MPNKDEAVANSKPLSAAEAAELLARLSDAQRIVLALGIDGFTSKEIARRLEIAPVTVDQRFAGARRKLGGQDRRDTLRIYRGLLIATEYEPTIYAPLTIGDGADRRPEAAPFDQSEHVVADSEADDSDFASLFFEARPSTEKTSLLPFARKEGQRNELTLIQRLLWSIGIALISMLALRTIIETLKDLGGL